MITTTRNATLEDLATMLQDQQTRKVDIVVPASKLRSVESVLVVDPSTEPVIDAEGVTRADGSYRPTEVCDDGIANRLGIPVKYLRKMRAERPDLYDANVNGWLHGRDDANGHTNGMWDDWSPGGHTDADTRSFLLRCFRNEQADQAEGIARAFLSQRFGIVDHLDMLTATLAGIRESGQHVEIGRCDLTDRRMYLEVWAPDVTAPAPVLGDGYRPVNPDPHGPGRGLIAAGFLVSNSETGGGAATITPRGRYEICANGLTVTKDAVRAIHLGERLDEGVVAYAQDTQRAMLEVVTKKARDAVSTFISDGYLANMVGEIEAKAGRPITGAQAAIEHVGTQLKFTEEETKGVLDHFIAGGQMTAGGVLNAVTSFTQTLGNADRAHELDGRALQVLEVIGS